MSDIRTWGGGVGSGAVDSGAGSAAEIRGLNLVVDRPGGPVPVVSDVSLSIGRGEIVGLVGESGSGKTLTGLAMAGLLPKKIRRISGDIEVAGRLVEGAAANIRRGSRRDGIAVVFQNPMTSLNPSMRVGSQVAEALRIHQPGLSRRAAVLGAVELFERVEIPDAAARAKQYPYEFSGGMRQRVMIAIALACNPTVLIADEPTTALDVTVQRGVMDLLQRLCSELDLGVLLVSHDLAVVSERCDRLMVMYSGEIVETGGVDEVLAAPLHPYVGRLLGCAPDRVASIDELRALPGRVPQPGEVEHGCTFAGRCDLRFDKCEAEAPQLIEVLPGRSARCHLANSRAGLDLTFLESSILIGGNR